MSGFRGVLLIVRKSLRQHALSTAVTAFGVAFGAGLLMAVVLLQDKAESAFSSNTSGFDGVVGARGSEVQLVLNSIFHMEKSTGNIPWRRYQEIKESRNLFKKVVPLMVGDNYRGFRIVGTESQLFTDHEYVPNRQYAIGPGGRVFQDQYAEAVVGSFVAERTGLTVGSTFKPVHGSDADNPDVHDLKITVVGILEPTNTPVDKAIWVPLEVYFRMPGHELRGTGESFRPGLTDPIPDQHKEISVALVQLRDGAHLGADFAINKSTNDLSLALISDVMARFFDKIAWIHKVFTLVAYMVVAVAAGSILTSIYNSMNERRREFAILRALGAKRGTVFGAIVLEAATIAAIGSVLGFALLVGLLWITAGIIRAQAGVVLDFSTFHPILWQAPVGIMLVGALAGTVPAAKAYRTDVATNLVPTS